jgi:hypothetical protein
LGTSALNVAQKGSIFTKTLGVTWVINGGERYIHEEHETLHGKQMSKFYSKLFSFIHFLAELITCFEIAIVRLRPAIRVHVLHLATETAVTVGPAGMRNESYFVLDIGL